MESYRSVFWFVCSRQHKCHAAATAPAGVRRRMERKQTETGGSG